MNCDRQQNETLRCVLKWGKAFYHTNWQCRAGRLYGVQDSTEGESRQGKYKSTTLKQFRTQQQRSNQIRGLIQPLVLLVLEILSVADGSSRVHVTISFSSYVMQRFLAHCPLSSFFLLEFKFELGHYITHIFKYSSYCVP